MIEGVLRMYIDRKLDMRGWESARIAAFMASLARMVAICEEDWQAAVKQIDVLESEYKAQRTNTDASSGAI